MPAQKVPQIRCYAPEYFKVYYMVDGLRFDDGRLMAVYLHETYGWGRARCMWEMWKAGLQTVKEI